MQLQPPPYDPAMLEAFVRLAGSRAWTMRLAELRQHATSGPRVSQAKRQRHALELAIERLRGPMGRPPSVAELHAARLAGEAVALSRILGGAGRTRLRDRLLQGLSGDGTLVPLFHLLRTAALQVSRGFSVTFAGLADAAPYDLLIEREALAAEIACEVLSAEDGRLVQRQVWSQLADAVDAALRAWLVAWPGRYLLKLTLPQGLNRAGLPALLSRIHRLLEQNRRQDHDAGAVLRLEPLVLAGGRTPDRLLLPALRHEFGPKAHLAAIASPSGVVVMAARAGRADEVALALRHRLFEVTPRRLTGSRPGILACFIEETDRNEWCGLREHLELEGEARQFLACQAARPVVAVTCASRFELFDMPDAVDGGELRFRNPAHPAASAAALRPAILSSV